MTSTVAEAKTWSISSGSLPAGVTIDASTGLISGTPTTAGQYNFTVLAKMNGDTRSGTKALGISVREPLTVTGPDNPALEVGVGYKTALKGAGGLPKYTWALTTGALPPGFTFWPGGAITGKPTTAGTYAFTVTLSDSEGRTTPYEGSLDSRRAARHRDDAAEGQGRSSASQSSAHVRRSRSRPRCF